MISEYPLASKSKIEEIREQEQSKKLEQCNARVI